MNARAQIIVLPDGRRHFHDGPIDLILEAFGERREVERAYDAAARRFVDVLDELCAELPLLRLPLSSVPKGAVARKMARAVAPFQQSHFLTPMAAVAGAVAEEILTVMTDATRLRRAYVNNGGDIALHLAPGQTFQVGMVGRLDQLSLFGRATISASDSARGIATSGWRGRSFSLGIADAVTVIADTAAMADAAATLIANAVDLPDHPAVTRASAEAIDPQSDLGDRLVTRGVGALSLAEIEAALQAGAREARHFRRLGLIEAAALRLCEQTLVVGGNESLYQQRRAIFHNEPLHAES